MGQILNLLKSDEKKSEQKNHNFYSERRQHYEYQHSFGPYDSVSRRSDWSKYNGGNNTVSRYGISNHSSNYGNVRNSIRSPAHSTFGENVTSERRGSIRANTVLTRPATSRLTTNDLQHSQYGHRSTGVINARGNIYPKRTKITLYHYTTNENANTICREKLVRSSSMSTPWKYRQHGCGVYFTSLGPSCNPKHLALNNFTNGGTHVTNGLYKKIRSVVEITFYDNEVEKIKAGHRDVYLYRGNIDLRNYEGRYHIYRNTNIF